MNGYELSRRWWDFSFENPDKTTTKHCALYLWLVEKNNRLGWVEKFGLPIDEAGAAIGLKKIQTVRETLHDLVKWGFVKIIVQSKNQYQSNIIAIANCDVETGSSLDNAICLTEKRLGTGSGTGSSIGQAKGYARVEHEVTQGSSTVPINKPINQETIKPINNNNIVVTDESVFCEPVEEKEIEEKKETAQKSLNIPFEVFWKMYGKSADKKKCELKWSRLTDKQRQSAINDIPDYINSLSDRKFQKNPLTYLNGENWNDERTPALPLQTSILNQPIAKKGKIQQNLESGLAAMERIRDRRKLQSL